MKDSIPNVKDSIPIVDTVKKVDTVKEVIWKMTPVPEKDMGNVWHSIFRPHSPIEGGNTEVRDTRVHLTLLPAGGYTLQTGTAAIISGNAAFYTDRSPNGKMSNISSSVTYSQYQQWIVPFTSNIWTKGNKFNIITDIRYIKYPSSIYGLGGRTDPNKGYTINFSNLKFHQTIMKSLSEDMYVGVGYFYDKFWDIKGLDKVSRQTTAQMKKELGKQEVASGLAMRFSYDSRLNQINPKQGTYYNITYRSSDKAWGSDSTWNSLTIDARSYVEFPKRSRNVLAFWMLDWMTTNGVPPYLLLPSTGWDDQYNTGRGYIQGRFRGKNMLYFESEYRFRISRNGLIGGVGFINIQNFSSDLSQQYARIFPGYGGGIRIKLNKYSDTNLCLDYGFGQNGSRGLFVNLGEVF
ncbi:hypothetical protein GCM10011511_39250 [Puia dinghuensis]|uniref:Bacterial surface antigen (D15) domain-containing protein n=1 Tax=Puia dinghuensis TaxID=1792502 RepID=A0A8J2UFT0_9BACT|nr:hypothetical protein GCM10011511_39250 [Puia dinghuensis]